VNIIGCNERWYMPESEPNKGDGSKLVCVRTVLVEGDIGDYAAYQGIGGKEYVADYGDKVSFEEACAHFPGGQLERERYRA
jgi:hypothetical protein